MLLLLAAVRKLFADTNRVMQGSWQVGRSVPCLQGKTLGLVAHGKISRAIHQCALGSGLNVLMYGPHILPCAIRRAGARPVDLDELLRE